MLIWITGLAGSGKTTIGKEVYNRLKEKKSNTVFLDGDSFREILGNDLVYSSNDRLENAKRIHRMCKFLLSQDIIVVCATMSLYKEIHQLNRENNDSYYEIFIDCEIDELIRRDQKGLYSEALSGKRSDVVGINLSYDEPINCSLRIDNTKMDNLDKKVDKIFHLINKK